MSVQSNMSNENLSNRQLRRSGLTVAIGFAILGAISAYRGHTIAPRAFWAVAVALLFTGLLQPGMLRPFMRLWFGLATVLGWINTRIVLSLLFYAVFTPVGVVMRFLRDPLDRRLHDGRTSYWVPKKAKTLDPKAYENQF